MEVRLLMVVVVMMMSRGLTMELWWSYRYRDPSSPTSMHLGCVGCLGVHPKSRVGAGANATVAEETCRKLSILIDPKK